MPSRKPRASGPAPAPKPAYHHGDLARALVQAAAQLVESGAGLTLRAAAQAAGVSPAAPYRHFADREALLAAVLTEGFAELADRTEKARRRVRDPMAALQAVGVAYVGFAAAHPRTYRLMFGPEPDKAAHPALHAAGRAAFGVLQQAVAACCDAGLVSPADAAHVALAGWSLSHGLASLHADGMLPGQDVNAIARALVRLLADGVRSRRPAR